MQCWFSQEDVVRYVCAWICVCTKLGANALCRSLIVDSYLQETQLASACASDFKLLVTLVHTVLTATTQQRTQAVQVNIALVLLAVASIVTERTPYIMGYYGILRLWTVGNRHVTDSAQ